MANRCVLTGKDVLSGNNVSHSKRRTRRRFLPNLQNITFISEALGKVSLKIAISTLRTVDKKGGLDKFLTNTTNKNLSEEAIKLKRKVIKLAEK